MAINSTDWLITSDAAFEVAFRIDVPGPDHRWWVLSYLPIERRLTRQQALAGVVLAELVVVELLGGGADWDGEVADMYAAELGLALVDVLCLLAVRGSGEAGESAGLPGTVLADA